MVAHLEGEAIPLFTVPSMLVVTVPLPPARLMLDASVRHCDFQRNNPKSALIYRRYVFRPSLATLHTATTGRDKTVQQLKGQTWEAVLNVITGFNQLQLDRARESPGNAAGSPSAVRRKPSSCAWCPRKGAKEPWKKSSIRECGREAEAGLCKVFWAMEKYYDVILSAMQTSLKYLTWALYVVKCVLWWDDPSCQVKTRFDGARVGMGRALGGVSVVWAKDAWDM